MNFKNNLKNLRKNKGYTQKSLAEKMGLPTQTIINWEQGKTQTSFEALEKLTYILECSYDDLLK
ncbi:MAG: helix-turn-helix domain-containing protein [Anaeroplasmataceae bacterium]|nr:helix-turn-helix domain-containing protein [Anaeroplasmataceae bacterium]